MNGCVLRECTHGTCRDIFSARVASVVKQLVDCALVRERGAGTRFWRLDGLAARPKEAQPRLLDQRALHRWARGKVRKCGATGERLTVVAWRHRAEDRKHMAPLLTQGGVVSVAPLAGAARSLFGGPQQVRAARKAHEVATRAQREAVAAAATAATAREQAVVASTSAARGKSRAVEAATDASAVVQGATAEQRRAREVLQAAEKQVEAMQLLGQAVARGGEGEGESEDEAKASLPVAPTASGEGEGDDLAYAVLTVEQDREAGAAAAVKKADGELVVAVRDARQRDAEVAQAVVEDDAAQGAVKRALLAEHAAGVAERAATAEVAETAKHLAGAAAAATAATNADSVVAAGAATTTSGGPPAGGLRGSVRAQLANSKVVPLASSTAAPLPQQQDVAPPTPGQRVGGSGASAGVDVSPVAAGGGAAEAGASGDSDAGTDASESGDSDSDASDTGSSGSTPSNISGDSNAGAGVRAGDGGEGAGAGAFSPLRSRSHMRRGSGDSHASVSSLGLNFGSGDDTPRSASGGAATTPRQGLLGAMLGTISSLRATPAKLVHWMRSPPLVPVPVPVPVQAPGVGGRPRRGLKPIDRLTG